MSATSGPLFDEPDFGSDAKQEHAVAPATALDAPAAPAAASTAAPPAAQPTPAEK